VNLFGEPHSWQRQINFGMLAGLISALVTRLFSLDPLSVTTIAAIIAAVLANIDYGQRLPAGADDDSGKGVAT
jgi:hypothetical protein